MISVWNRWRVTEFLRPEEVESLISIVPLPGDQLLLRTLWETGGRPGEVARLTPEHIDPIHNCIILPNFKQNKRKDPSSPKLPTPLKRIYLFPESELCDNLIDHCKTNQIKTGEWVFPSRWNSSKPFNTVTLWRMVTKVAAELGIRYIKKDRRTGEYMNKPAWPHLVRHGRGHYLVERTGRLDVVRDQLGHSTVRTTEVYAHLTDEDRKRVIQGEN